MSKEQVIDASFIKKKVEQAMARVFEEGQIRHKNDPGRVKNLRISSFPFCGVQWFLNLPKSTAKYTKVDTRFRYYTSVGTAVHDTVQAVLATIELEAIKIRVVADWRCAKCTRLHKMAPRPYKCKNCFHEEFEFHECTVEYGQVLGHVDTIFEITLSKPTADFPDGVCWLVLDYKTTKLEKLGTDRLVSRDNKSQIRSYVALLRRMKKPVLPFAVLVYIPRDDPVHLEPAVLSVNFEVENRRIDSYREQFNAAVSASTKEDIKELVAMRPCQNKLLKQFEYCQWRGMCACVENEGTILKELLATRLKVESRLPIKDWNP